MNNEFEFTQDQRVAYDNGVVKGTGKVVGVATAPQAIIGRSYIIEPDESIKSETYPYTHFVCFEVHMEAIKPVAKNEHWEEEKRKDSPHHYNNRLD